MNRDEIISAAQQLASEGKPFMLGTVDQQGGPQMRWMGGLVLEEPLVVWMACGAQSRKVAQLAANPQAQLVFTSPDYMTVATLSGTCEIRADAESRQKVWDGIPALARYSSGPQDPAMVAMRFVTQRVELLGMAAGMQPQVAEL